MSAHVSTTADAAPRGIRLTIPVRVGGRDDAIELEPAHLEWLVRVAAYVAVRDGLAGMPETLAALLAPGVVRERHGDVLCLESFAVELRDARGRQAARVGFPRSVLEPFVVARAVHRVLESEAKGTQPFASSLHATMDDAEPWPVAVPALPHLSIAALAKGASAEGAPTGRWAATFVTRQVLDGFDRLDGTSRARGVETAGRIHTRVGFDRKARMFVRILERLVVTEDVVATGTTIVSRGASWGEFLAATPRDGTFVPSHVHTHLHLAADGEDALGGEARLEATAKALISVPDRVAHLTNFTDPLAVSAILSLYPDRRAVHFYGYTPDGRLDADPGYWRIDT